MKEMQKPRFAFNQLLSLPPSFESLLSRKREKEENKKEEKKKKKIF